MGVVFFFVFAGAMAPPTGQDELCYHLTQPKLYVQKGAVYDVPYATSSLWPYLTEMLFTLGLLIQGPALAKLFHFSFYLLTGAVVYSWVRCHQSRPIALYSAAIFWLTPAVFIQAAFAYVDNALACYVLLSFYALFIFIQKNELRWAALAGIFTGLAMSVKLIGLFIFPLAITAFIWRSIAAGRRGEPVCSPKPEGRHIGLPLLIFVLAGALAGGIWYLRAWILRGNPVFPFYPHFFGGHGWFDSTYTGIHGRGKDAVSFLLLVWDTAIRPERFGGERVGWAYLVLLLLAVFLPKISTARFTGALALGYTAVWFIVDQNIRFYFPALALWSVAAGTVVFGFLGKGAGSWTRGATALFLCFLGFQGLVFAVHYFRDEAALLFGRLSADRYLSAREESYEAAKAVNRTLKPSDHILSTGEIKGYYFNNPFTLEGDFSRFTVYGEKFQDVSSVIAFLKSESFTHVLTSTKGGGLDESETGWRVSKILDNARLREQFFREDLIVQTRDVRYVLYEIL